MEIGSPQYLMPAPSCGITLNARPIVQVLAVNQSHGRWVGDTNMRRVFLISTILTLTTTVGAVSGSSQLTNPAPQASQHGIVAQTVNRVVITLEYDRPVARGRELFGNLVEYDAIWTPGANRSTWIDFSEPVELEGHPLDAGRYGIWMVPKENEPWELIVVSDWDRDHALYPFGAEVFRANVSPETGAHMEVLAYYFPVVGPYEATLRLHWGSTIIPLRIEVGG